MDDDNVGGGDINDNDDNGDREDCQMQVIPSTPLIIHINNNDKNKTGAGGVENGGVELDDIADTPEMKSSTLDVYIE